MPPGGGRADAVRVGLALLAFGALFAGSLATVVDPDLYHGLAYGRLLFTSGSFPRGDVFAFTPTVPVVVHHEWGLGALHYVVIATFGRMGLVVLRLAVEGGAVGGAFALACRRGARLPVLLVVGGMALGLIAPGLTLLRAQAWTLLFTVALAWLLELDRRGSRSWVPLYLGLHVVWLNAHGGFVVGMGLVALHAAEQALAGRPWRHLLWVTFAAAALTVVNPYGVEYHRYLWSALRLDRDLITEWRPLWATPSPVAAAWNLWVWLLSVLLLAYGLRHAPRDRRAGWLLTLVTACLCLRHQRHVSIYGLVWVAHVPPMLQAAPLGRAVDRLWRARPSAVAAVLGVVLAWLLVGIAADPPWRVRVPALPGDATRPEERPYPVGPVEHLRDAGFEGNALVPFRAGGYVSWQLHPAVRVSIDGRWEAAFPPALLAEHLRFFAAEDGWRATLARHPVDVVIAERSAPIAGALEAEPRWRVVYRDDGWVVVARPGLALPVRDRSGELLSGTFP